MKRILFPTDFSKQANRAISYGLQILERELRYHPVECLFMHVHVPANVVTPQAGAYVASAAIAVGEDLKVKQKEMNQIIEKWSHKYPGIKYRELIVNGAIIPAVREVVQEEKIDMIVLGSKGTGGLEQAILGSTANGLAQRAPCPVMIIPEDSTLHLPQKVVFATDFKNLVDMNMLAPLKDVISSFDAEIMLLNIYVKEDFGSSAGEDLVGDIADYLDTDKFDFFFLEESDTVKGIEDFVTGYHADMLVLVAQERKFFERLFHRSVTKRLLYHSKVPLLVLHPIFWGEDEDDEETFRDKVKLQIENWQMELDRMKVQAHLGSKEASEQMEKGKDAAMEKIAEIKDQLDKAGSIAQDKWKHFQKEMAEAFTHVKKAITG